MTISMFYLQYFWFPRLLPWEIIFHTYCTCFDPIWTLIYYLHALICMFEWSIIGGQGASAEYVEFFVLWNVCSLCTKCVTIAEFLYSLTTLTLRPPRRAAITVQHGYEWSHSLRKWVGHNLAWIWHEFGHKMAWIWLCHKMAWIWLFCE